MLGVAEPAATVEIPAATLRREKIMTGSSIDSNHFKLKSICQSILISIFRAN